MKTWLFVVMSISLLVAGCGEEKVTKKEFKTYTKQVSEDFASFGKDLRKEVEDKVVPDRFKKFRENELKIDIQAIISDELKKSSQGKKAEKKDPSLPSKAPQDPAQGGPPVAEPVEKPGTVTEVKRILAVERQQRDLETSRRLVQERENRRREKETRRVELKEILSALDRTSQKTESRFKEIEAKISNLGRKPFPPPSLPTNPPPAPPAVKPAQKQIISENLVNKVKEEVERRWEEKARKEKKKKTAADKLSLRKSAADMDDVAEEPPSEFVLKPDGDDSADKGRWRKNPPFLALTDRQTVIQDVEDLNADPAETETPMGKLPAYYRWVTKPGETSYLQARVWRLKKLDGFRYLRWRKEWVTVYPREGTIDLRGIRGYNSSVNSAGFPAPDILEAKATPAPIAIPVPVPLPLMGPVFPPAGIPPIFPRGGSVFPCEETSYYGRPGGWWTSGSRTVYWPRRANSTGMYPYDYVNGRAQY